MNVVHDIPNHRFVAVLPEGEGELVYAVRGPKLLDLQHTGVPPALRHHGVAEALAHAALDYAREQGDQVIPSCPFVRKWLAQHPDYQDLVAEGR